MESLLDNAHFISDYQKLMEVSLNPSRHTAPNGFEHCELVRTRVGKLAKLNNCSDEESLLLKDLARLHDIGKITGSSKPSDSVELLKKYHIKNHQIAALIKYHDLNLSWYISMQKGQMPGDKAWKRLSKKVNLLLLCIFMIADRVDCPGGWHNNKPLVWFLKEVKKRGLLSHDFCVAD